MKFSRRSFLAGASLLAILASPANAWLHGIAVPIGQGWNTLPLGCGGLPTGIHIANDGSMVCRTDVGNIYRWSGKTTDYQDPSQRWIPLMTFEGLGASAKITQSTGGWEHVLAPNDSNTHYAIFPDIAGNATKGWVYYGDWNGTKVAWNQSNLSFLNSTTESNGNPGAIYKNSCYKIAVDPANKNVAYCGMPFNSGLLQVTGFISNGDGVTSGNKLTVTSGTPSASGQGQAVFSGPGGTNYGTIDTTNSASGSASSIAGTTFTPGGTTSGTFAPGMLLTGTGVAAGTYIVSGSGPTYTVNNSQTVGPVAISGRSYTLSASNAVAPTTFNLTPSGMNGEIAGAYTTLNQAGGSTPATWAPVKTSGATPVPAVASGVSCGLAFDPTQGTTTVGGQTVTKHIIIPIGGVGIYESTDGGVTFSEIAVSAFGTTSFYITNAWFNSVGAYFCVSVSSTAFGIWRYASGSWTKISAAPMWTTAGNYVPSTCIVMNPSDPNFLSVVGPVGIGYGFTTHNAMDPTPTWAGRTGGASGNVVNKAASYDIGYINYIYGQGSVFSLVVSCMVDPLTGIFFKTGNQSIYYNTASQGSTVGIGPPDYTSPGSTYMQSIGRGMEVTVAQDILCPPGGTYPVLATQDLGTPMRGTFTTYPNDMVIRYKEYTCENLEYAASDPSFVVARATGQSGSFDDVSSYSPNYGKDGTWSQIADTPTALWQAAITATISNGAGGAGTILDVSAISGRIFPGAVIAATALGGGTQYGQVKAYGTGGTTGTGGVGTYILSATSTLLTPTAIFASLAIQGGQTVAVDHDHWVTVPAGSTGTVDSVQHIPAYTTNATGAATWALCNGLPVTNWTRRPWTFGLTPKPLAVGYGADLGTVWACVFDYAGTATLYRSTDSGANFSPIATWSVTTLIAAGGAPIVCAVPGFPNELWVSGGFSGGAPVGVWRVTNANTASATVTAMTLPSDANNPRMFTLGAPATPGGYPTLYYAGITGGDPNSPLVLYEGQWNGSSVTWTKFGATGKQQDLPKSCQIIGLNAIRGDWNVYRRIYGATAGMGLAYYNP